MSFRITDSTRAQRLTQQINAARQRLDAAQEQVATGKRINHPSDDPSGASAIFRLRTTQIQLDQFTRNLDVAKESLSVADTALESYQQAIDRTRVLLARAATDPTLDKARVPIATELAGIIDRVREVANTQFGDHYVFGGTRLSAPPFDNNGVLTTVPTTDATVQADPQGNLVSTSVTAESFLADASGTIFDVLKTALTAVQGTGNATNDASTLRAAVDRLRVFTDLSSGARARVGENLNHATDISDRLKQYNLALEDSAQRIENVDLAEAATALKESDTVLNAILQAGSQFGRRTLMDFLG
ncbi:MAG: flagellar hook-associated protein FlgL [Blastocatellia bacterium]